MKQRHLVRLQGRSDQRIPFDVLALGLDYRALIGDSQKCIQARYQSSEIMNIISIE